MTRGYCQRTKHAKRTQRNMQATGDTHIPEADISLVKLYKPDGDGVPVLGSQYKRIVSGEILKGPAGSQGVACM